MQEARNFFSKDEQEQIIQAIQRAEKRTSGEIRVHVADKLKGEIMDDAAEIFRKLEMDKTAEKNGVLILIIPSEKKFAIVGDAGIHQHVGDNFWDEVKNLMRDEFANGKMVNGLITGIDMAGEKLQAYFPLLQNDKNELSDEISF